MAVKAENNSISCNISLLRSAFDDFSSYSNELLNVTFCAKMTSTPL